MLARAVHAHGNRRAPFVRLDCAASTPEEIEIRVFGSPSARTAAGAPERHRIERIGSTCLLAEAHGGILFIKNITEMPARVQARLVRVLRDREVFLEDASESSPIQVRPIVAGDGTIGAAVEEGQLRADLYERISLIRIDVPPLRQRREDIPVLAAHLLKDLCRVHAVPMKTLTRSASTLLSALPWRGNIPELSGLVERLVLVVPQGLIRLEDVLSHTQLEGTASRSGADTTLREARIRFEREYISSVLQRHNGRIADAARTLGIQRTNLYRMMRRLNLALPRSVDRER
jgi:DNA-binding NtrC family response regulator